MRKITLVLTGALAAGSLLFTAACGDDSTVTDTGASDTSTADTGGDTSTTDSSTMDSTVSDTSTPTDTSVPVDTGPPPPCEDPTIPELSTERVAGGSTFVRPLFITQAPGNSDTLWVVQRGGQIVLVRGDTIAGTFLDISDRVGTSDRRGEERGLLGLAFHPGYASNGRFYVYYTSSEDPMNDVVAEYTVSSDPDVADRAETRLAAWRDRQDNHNGGMLTFGPDGFLYVGTGDEGGGCDEHGDPGNGQSLDTFHGKLLRLDVENSGGDYVAAGNPFVGAGGGALPQIWAYGLRNPWRFSIDQPTGDLYIGDVGQNAIEEINITAGGGTGGENYGWRFWEADERSSRAGSGCDDTGYDTIDHTEPQIVIQQGSGSEVLRGACSITGGYVYRGSAIPDLRGIYLFGDWCSNDIAAARYCEGALRGPVRAMDVSSVAGGLASFGQDQAGELYLVFLGDQEIYKIVPAAP